MKAPSGLQEIELLKTLARKLTGLLSPPAEGTTETFLKDLPLTDAYAIHLPSGDQTNGRSDMRGGRSKYPVASARSCFDSRSSTLSSFASRSNASILPSGENRGNASCID